MARHKYNGVRDSALGIKKTPRVNLNPPVRETAEATAKWKKDRAERRARQEKEAEELKEKKWERQLAEWAKVDVEEKEKPRGPCNLCRRRHIKCNRADFCDQCRKRNCYVCEYRGE
ncbi:hypothetical protein MMC11_007376 [Xylographa trunciseda]|nr:hypothetical protein [Xylographa trunciseda]